VGNDATNGLDADEDVTDSAGSHAVQSNTGTRGRKAW
jgi:hypothetical protein